MARRRRRRELFAADRGLQGRMVAASVLTPLLVLAAAAMLVAVAPVRIVAVVALAAVIGVWGAVHAQHAATRERPLTAAEAPEVHAALERLCAQCDLPKPELVLTDERQPNSWVVAPLRSPPKIHLTSGLVALLSPAELEAVLAHELAHVAHRDAVVMTAVGGPGAVLLEGGKRVVRGGWWLAPGALVSVAIGWVARLGTNALSRYRELAADTTAAALTGRPAALASALVKVTGGLQRLPQRDLRAAAGRDAFHLLPAEPAAGRLAPLVATHPPLARRIARLEHLEREMHARGRAYDGD